MVGMPALRMGDGEPARDRVKKRLPTPFSRFIAEGRKMAAGIDKYLQENRSAKKAVS